MKRDAATGNRAERWDGPKYGRSHFRAFLDKRGEAIRCANAAAKDLADADMQSYFGSRGFSVGGSSSPAEFAAFVAGESAKWARIVKASRAKAD